MPHWGAALPGDHSWLGLLGRSLGINPQATLCDSTTPRNTLQRSLPRDHHHRARRQEQRPPLRYAGQAAHRGSVPILEGQGPDGLHAQPSRRLADPRDRPGAPQRRRRVRREVRPSRAGATRLSHPQAAPRCRNRAFSRRHTHSLRRIGPIVLRGCACGMRTRHGPTTIRSTTDASSTDRASADGVPTGGRPAGGKPPPY